MILSARHSADATRILGIDPGSRLCGYGVIDARPGVTAYVECGVLSADVKRPMELRLGDMAKWLTDVISEFQPDEIAVESVFTHVNVKSALALAQARGMVLAVAGIHGLSVASYAPRLIKKTITGRGAASKDQVALMVRTLVGLSKAPQSDAADALAVALTHSRELEKVL